MRAIDRPYGLAKADLTKAQFEKVQLRNYFAQQTALVLLKATDLGKPWVFENPEPCGNHPSVFY